MNIIKSLLIEQLGQYEEQIEANIKDIADKFHETPIIVLKHIYIK